MVEVGHLTSTSFSQVLGAVIDILRGVENEDLVNESSTNL